MKNWLIGGALGVLALVVLYFAAASARHSPQVSWMLIALFAALVATVIVLVGRFASHAGPAPDARYVERPGTGPRFEISETGEHQNPWAGTGRTLGIMAVGLVGLLAHLGMFIAAAYLQVGWVIYVGLALTAAVLIIVTILAAPREI